MLEAKKPQGAKEVAEAIGKAQRSVEFEFQRFRNLGIVVRTNPCPSHSKWELTGKQWTKEGDHRGQSPGSVKALQNWVRTGGNIGNLKFVKLKLVKGRYHPKPKAKTALEQAWGWLPNTESRLVDNDDDTGSNGSGTVRPESAEVA